MDSDAIAALQEPEAWPHPVISVELIETHISWVLLTGDYAYKIKKPVDFGFLDFSTLEKRKYYCEEEVRLNRRLAPDIYLDVVPICGEPEAPMVSGAGPVLDYAVRMRQFDTGQGFDQLLKRGELDVSHMDRAAEILAAFHAAVDRAGADSAYSTPAVVSTWVRENFDEIRQHLDEQIEDAGMRNQFTMLERWSEDANNSLEAIFTTRLENGFVRECHGDLHLRNLVCWQGEVIPFDCIEFNPNLRWTDVMCELAFLLMDLDDHGRPDLAGTLLNAYLEHSGDYMGLQVLRFYQVYRALVRAKVASLRLTQDPGVKAESVEEIENYLELASQYTRTHLGRLVISHGLSGSGKTFVSRQLLGSTGIIRLRSDIERKRLFGLSAQENSHSEKQGGIYHPDASARTYAHLLELVGKLTSWGFSVLVDAAFLEAGQRQLFQDYAEDQQIPFLIMHCESGLELQRQRLIARGQQTRDASEADLAILDWQIQHQDPLTEAELRDSVTVDTSTEPVLDDVLTWLAL